jgi:hypothetical protein
MTIEQLKELLTAFSKTASTGAGVTDEDVRKLLDAFKSVESGKVRPAEDQMSELLQAIQYTANTPTGRRAMMDHIKDYNTTRFVQRYKPFFDAAFQGFELVTALKQVREANEALGKLKPPALPPPPKESPYMGRLKNLAEGGNLEAARAIAPVQQQIDDTFRADIGRAKAVSGGDAGSFNARANQASLNRLRAAMQLPGIRDNIMSRFDNMKFQYGGMENALRQQDYQNQMGVYDRLQNQYIQDADAAAELGQAGWTNLFNVLNSATGTIPSILGRIGKTNLPVLDPQSNTIYDPQIAAYDQQLTNSLTRLNRNRFGYRNILPNAGPYYQPSDKYMNQYSNFTPRFRPYGG